MRFSTEACLPNLRPPLDSLCQNESRSGLRSWFRVPVGPCTQNEANLKLHFSQFVSKNMTFFQATPNIGILCTFENYFLSWVQFWIITSQFITNWLKSTMNGLDCTVRGHQKTCTLTEDLGMNVKSSLSPAAWWWDLGDPTVRSPGKC